MPRRIRHCPITLFFAIVIIVIKPGPGIDPVKGPGPRFYGSTRVNPDQPGKIKKYILKFEYLYEKIKKKFM